MNNDSNLSLYKNRVELLDFAGSDLHIAITAWASTHLDLGLVTSNNIKDRVPMMIDAILSTVSRRRTPEELIRFLGLNQHSSPFRSSWFMFAFREDVATHIHLLKHVVLISNTNSESARYKEVKDKMYLPEDWLDTEVGEYWHDLLELYTQMGFDYYHRCVKEMIAAGHDKARVKETARYFLTMNSQRDVVRTLTLDGLIQLYYKRGPKSKSQKEVQKIVEDMLNAVKNIEGNPFKYSLEAFNL